MREGRRARLADGRLPIPGVRAVPGRRAHETTARLAEWDRYGQYQQTQTELGCRTPDDSVGRVPTLFVSQTRRRAESTRESLARQNWPDLALLAGPSPRQYRGESRGARVDSAGAT